MPRESSAEIPGEIEEYRDQSWCREESLRVEDATGSERMIERLGFASCMTDSRQPGPSLYVAVCGRRDAVMPRNVQKDPESSLTWLLKDELIRRGKVYYGKIARARTLFLAKRMIAPYRRLFGLTRREERSELSIEAQAILRVLRREWEMASADLRREAAIGERAVFNRALDELQARMIVIPLEVVYAPKFTYIWTLTEARFPEELKSRPKREEALGEVAGAFLKGAGMTIPGELARATGLSRPDAGIGNQRLVARGEAISPSRGFYLLPKFSKLAQPE